MKICIPEGLNQHRPVWGPSAILEMRPLPSQLLHTESDQESWINMVIEENSQSELERE